MIKCSKCVPATTRRSFLRFSLGAGAVAAAGGAPLWAQQTVAKAAKKAGKGCILLWMGGGPSQLDTWDPKPGKKTGGEFKAIPTSAPGVSISETLPKCAAQMKHMSIIRSIHSPEGAHERGTDLMHTGTRPIPGLDFPAIGTVISYELGDKKFPLPHFIAIDPPAISQSRVFGDEYLPFRINNAQNPIPNIRRGIGEERDKQRAQLLLEQSADWESKRMQKEVDRLKLAYVKSEEMMNTPLLKAFTELGSEPGDLRSEYGGRFGTNCLLARRLVEAGCSFVEIGMGGWDTHDNNFEAVRSRCKELDPGMGTLVKDLAEKGMLKDTMVVWMGEFGRTPDVNPGNGRDHYPRNFSVVVAGGGIQGGRVIGDSGPEGYDAVKQPVPIQNLFATIYKALGINHLKEYVTETRRMKYAYGEKSQGGTGSPIKELF